MQRTLSISEAARTLSIGRTKIYELLKNDEMRTIRVGRRRLILANDVDAFVERALSGEAR
jgi:excisionase family DNA binding protein